MAFFFVAPINTHRYSLYINVCIYLKVRAEGGQNVAMTEDLLSLTAQSDVTQGPVETQPVESL